MAYATWHWHACYHPGIRLRPPLGWSSCRASSAVKGLTANIKDSALRQLFLGTDAVSEVLAGATGSLT